MTLYFDLSILQVIYFARLICKYLYMYIDVPLSFAIDFYDLQHGFFATHPCSFILTQVLMALIHFLTSILYCFLHLLLLFYYFLHFYYSFKDLHEFALQRMYIYFFTLKPLAFSFFYIHSLALVCNCCCLHWGESCKLCHILRTHPLLC